jgi:hypothetical protein
MGWFKTKIRNWVLSDDECKMETEGQYVSLNKLRGSIAVDHDRLDGEKGIRFTAYKASGGMVIETNFYDRRKDTNHRTLHIITDEKDLGKEIGKIITLESLKQ